MNTFITSMAQARFLSLLFVLLILKQSSMGEVRIGIIGGGIAGASTAYYLRNLLEKDIDTLDITVFEQRNIVGGRIKDINFEGATIEVGSEGFISDDKNLMKIVDELQLPYHHHNSPRMAVWDGHQWYDTSKDYLLSRAEIYFHIERFRLKRAANYFLRGQEGIFESVQQFLHNGRIDELATLSSADLAKRGSMDPAYVFQEWLPVCRHHFNHDLSMNAYAGLYALLPENFGYFSIVRGNQRLIRAMLNVSKARVKLNSRVERVIADGTDGFRLVYVDMEGNFLARSDHFDFVVVASPLETLQFSNISLPSIPKRYFQSGFVTLVSALSLNPRYFSTDFYPIPENIFTVENTTTPFISIVTIGNTADGVGKIYKIKSVRDISQQIPSMFIEPEYQFIQPWQFNYPLLNPGQEPQPIKLNKRLIYTGALETLLPTMESSVISARNAALLIKEQLTGKPKHYWQQLLVTTGLVGLGLFLLSTLLPMEKKAANESTMKTTTLEYSKVSTRDLGEEGISEGDTNARNYPEALESQKRKVEERIVVSK